MLARFKNGRAPATEPSAARKERRWVILDTDKILCLEFV
jgi:hypothetical protein